jgi:hypothetical protein
MAMRVKDGVEPINRPTDMGRGGSRPKPPKAGARSASLEAPRPMSDHQTAKRRLTPKTVALDSAKGAALGTLHFSTGIQKPTPAKAGGFAFGGGPGGNASGRVSGQSPERFSFTRLPCGISTRDQRTKPSTSSFAQAITCGMDCPLCSFASMVG